jgi:hypothetical protein
VADNPFSVQVPSMLQALTIGEDAHDKARKRVTEEEIKFGRQRAFEKVQAGGDPREIVGDLIKLGDMSGAHTMAGFLQNQSQLDHQGRVLAETSRFHTGTLENQRATTAETARHHQAVENKPTVLPWGSGMVKPDGTVVREPGGGEAMLDQGTLDFMARQYMAGDTSVLTNLGRGAQGAANVVALRKRVAELNQQHGAGGADQANRNAEFMGVKAGQRTLGTRSANIELAATEFEQVLPVVQKASQAVSRTNYPDLNRIIQSYETRTGDPNIVAFGGAVNTLVNLYARAISPSGIPTVHDKEHAREILNKAWSQGQFDAAVGMMKQEIDAALKSPEKVRDDMRTRFLRGQPSSNLTGPDRTITGVEVTNLPPLPPGFQVVR